MRGSLGTSLPFKQAARSIGLNIFPGPHKHFINATFISLLLAIHSLSFAHDPSIGSNQGSENGPKKSATQYWQETGINLPHLNFAVDAQYCQQNADLLEKCITAFNEVTTVLPVTEGRAFLLPTDYIKKYFPKIEPLSTKSYWKANFGEVSIVALPFDPRLVGKDKYPKEQEALKHAWAKLDQKLVHEQKNIPFDLIISWLSHSLKEIGLYDNFGPYLAGSAIRALYRSVIDEHTGIVPTAFLEERAVDKGMTLGSIGAAIRMHSRGYIVLLESETEQNPAYAAGLRNGDIVTAINDEEIVMEPSGTGYIVHNPKVLEPLGGKPGDKVKLTIQRRDQTSHHHLEFVESKVLVVESEIKTLNASSGRPSARYGYLRVKDFSSLYNCRQVVTAYQSFLQAKVSGILFDLRGNQGGRSAILRCIAAVFMDNGDVLARLKALKYNQATRSFSIAWDVEKPLAVEKPMDFRVVLEDEESKEGEEKQEKIDAEASVLVNTGPLTLPMVVLINHETASSAEMLTAAMQDTQKAIVVGRRSFGKGTGMTYFPWLHSPLVTLHQTVARYFRQDGLHTLQGYGVTPDLELEIAPQKYMQEKGLDTGTTLNEKREMDLDGSVIAKLGPDWQQPRPKVIEKIQNCRSQLGYADDIFWQEHNQNEGLVFTDYMRLQAEESLQCMIQLGIGPKQAER